MYWTAYGYPSLVATAGEDYLPVSGTLTFAPGEISKTISVPVVGDTIFERLEPFLLRLNSPTNVVTYTPGGPSGVGTIVDTDRGLFLNDYDWTWRAIRDLPIYNSRLPCKGSSQVVTVNYASADGGLDSYHPAATAGVDYAAAVSGTLTFLPGETSKSIAVTVYGDTTYEAYQDD